MGIGELEHNTKELIFNKECFRHMYRPSIFLIVNQLLRRDRRQNWTGWRIISEEPFISIYLPFYPGIPTGPDRTEFQGDGCTDSLSTASISKTTERNSLLQASPQPEKPPSCRTTTARRRRISIETGKPRASPSKTRLPMIRPVPRPPSSVTITILHPPTHPKSIPMPDPPARRL
ncbi:hypothetical protein K505DRAFT_97202 [Melanomma pulvis-pyrius CBS 109.77]|uniref:Uncharacterized protein n=1 Tax=Melanomma pulvis-pyrius CBS 109.77 TaxID=1314802 RepID=A0A6A6WY93_9PLEO|nr:hypothetical protein K505DRAFT_97202 [Melanomma pulvis-pyrius CBS 109.77]